MHLNSLEHTRPHTITGPTAAERTKRATMATKTSTTNIHCRDAGGSRKMWANPRDCSKRRNHSESKIVPAKGRSETLGGDTCPTTKQQQNTHTQTPTHTPTHSHSRRHTKCGRPYPKWPTPGHQYPRGPLRTPAAAARHRDAWPVPGEGTADDGGCKGMGEPIILGSA